MLSTTIVRPRRYSAMQVYFFSNDTSSLAIPIYPAEEEMPGSFIFLPFTDVSGRKVARPALLLFKKRIAAFADVSSSTIMFDTDAPRAVSIAVTYSPDTVSRRETGPHMPDKLLFVITAFTLPGYPSRSASIFSRVSLR